MKNHCMGASGLLVCLIMASLLVITNLHAQQNPGSGDGILAVWSQAHGDEYPILLSRQTADGWSNPEKLSSNNTLNLVPSITTDHQGVIWVVWASVDGHNTNLLYKKFQDNGWSEEKKVETGFSSNTAPSIVVDHNNVLWLTWSAFDGQDDEIYSTFWNGSGFEPPVRVTDNQVPDILPISSFDSTTTIVSVQWQGFAEGDYLTFQSNYSDGSWSAPARQSGQSEQNQQAMGQQQATDGVTTQNIQAETVEVELPDFLHSRPSLSLHVKGKIIQSLPARLLQVEDE